MKITELFLLLFLINLVCNFHAQAAVNIQYISIETAKEYSYRYLCHPTLHGRALLIKSTRWKYATIENLDEYIKPFATKNCLGVLDNFQNINLNITSTPMIIRKPVPLCQTDYKEASHSFKREIWGPSNIIFENTSLLSSSELRCPQSRFFIGDGIDLRNTLPDACIRLNLHRYSLSMKPWNCKVHFVLHPVFYPKEEFGQFWPSPFNVEASEKLYSYEYTPSVPIINVLIAHFKFGYLQMTTLKQLLFESLFPKGIPGLREIEMSSIHEMLFTDELRRRDIGLQNIFLILSPVLQQANFQGSQFELSALIQHAYVLKFISGNWMNTVTWNDVKQLIVMRNLKNFSTAINTKSQFNSLAFRSSTENSLWTFHNDMRQVDHKNVYFGALIYMETCGKIATANRKLGLSKRQRKFSQQIAEIWLSILGNYTILQLQNNAGIRLRTADGNEVVIKGSPKAVGIALAISIGLQRVSYKNLYYYTSYFPSRGVDNFQFVSCGTRTISSLAFNELFNIFDQWIWISIVITTLLISSITTLYSNRCKFGLFLHNCLSQGKVLLEQGDPYSERLHKATFLRLLLGSFLLVGVVLSNAYKNSNVYNLITPRKPLPFETFRELKMENFTIFSRIGEVIVENILKRPEGNTVSMELSTGGSRVFLSGASDYHVSVDTEIMAFITSLHRAKKPSELSENDVTMNPTLIKWFINTYENISKINISERGYLLNQMERFKKQEISYFIGRMEKCDKIALLLNEDACGKVAQQVKQKKFYLPVSIGKKIYYGINELITMTGFVPRGIIRRVKGIGESGIWNWWTPVGARTPVSSKLDSGTPPPQPASMTGNLIILFWVWKSGLGLSTFIIIVETCRQYVLSTGCKFL